MRVRSISVELLPQQRFYAAYSLCILGELMNNIIIIGGNGALRTGGNGALRTGGNGALRTGGNGALRTGGNGALRTGGNGALRLLVKVHCDCW